MPSKQGKYAGIPTDQDAEIETATATAVPVAAVATAADASGKVVEPFQIGSVDDDDDDDDVGGGVDAAKKSVMFAGGGEGATPTISGEQQNWTKGTVQPPRYRDVWFAVAFLVQFLAVVVVAMAFGSEALALMKQGADTGSRHLGRVLYHTGSLERDLKKKHGHGNKHNKHHDEPAEEEEPAVEENAEEEENKDDDDDDSITIDDDNIPAEVKEEIEEFQKEEEKAEEGEKMDDDSQQFEDLYDDDDNTATEVITVTEESSSYSPPEESSSSFESSGQTDSEDGLPPPPEAFLPLVIVASVVAAPFFTVAALGYMSRNAAQLIRASLYVAVGLNVLFTLFALFAGVLPSAIMHAVFAAILFCYAKAVWHRIPYAASNLRSAIVAVKANMGVGLVAFAGIPASIVWLFTWTFAFMGTLTMPFMYTTTEVETTDSWSESGSGTQTQTDLSGAGIAVVLAFILSLHWTNQVINGVVRTTIAGVIGTWWFSPLEASSFCSSAVRDSLARSLTYSFGSICFGSLIVAIIETLRAWLRGASRQRNAIVRLIAQCLLLWIERIVQYFNKWAFVYVGLYGYSYLEAGKSVMTLFRDRGWTAIISDNLVNRMLGLACVAIGLLVAMVAVIAGLLTEVTGGSMGWLAVAAWIGFFVGFILACIMMGVLSGSVDSIIVCFAEAPMEFKENHPDLHTEMEESWASAWPDLTFTPVAMAVPIGGPNALDASLN
mmetsp:Transcript_7002/g.12596  ORF Transcript_7002/g.12596 Transcript_7002/m.12596 type:complete len:720 (-) Transcript_7002:225-2384(-)|eukprot:CAMPEP_0197442364 /NCGR_PEP_ID=MMETSP1175-20131217/8394_1 /TAXON_ID=1003142 /ORGANISM="Triceratium dubium, Strain CCMP147" /LENGTH=719 /DNA_ID=CAMNT_0042972823 /DNA_START=85 /DNA_END=2244 /DNA_ORIENTATION=+